MVFFKHRYREEKWYTFTTNNIVKYVARPKCKAVSDNLLSIVAISHFSVKGKGGHHRYLLDLLKVMYGI